MKSHEPQQSQHHIRYQRRIILYQLLSFELGVTITGVIGGAIFTTVIGGLATVSPVMVLALLIYLMRIWVWQR